MKLEKAIEILDKEPITCEPGRKPELEQALKLGIEALKRLDKARKERRFDRLGLLPGETKD